MRPTPRKFHPFSLRCSGRSKGDCCVVDDSPGSDKPAREFFRDSEGTRCWGCEPDCRLYIEENARRTGEESFVSIVVEDFHKTYGNTVAVTGITFSVAPGEILGLAGPNGAGKTTTLRALAGILKPTRGRLLIAGYDLEAHPVQAKAQLAYVPDDPRLFDRLTVWEHFRFVVGAYRLGAWQARAEQLLERLELVEKRDALTSEL